MLLEHTCQPRFHKPLRLDLCNLTLPPSSLSVCDRGGHASTVTMSGERLRNCGAHGDYKQLMILLTGGANPCSVNDDGLTALHMAVWNGHIECVEGLCVHDIGRNREGEAKSCINYQSSGGFTALHLAAMDGINAIEIITILLLCGADPYIKDFLDRTPYDIAKAYERDDAIIAKLQMPHVEPEGVVYFRQQLMEKHPLDLAKYSEEFQELAEEASDDNFVDKPNREPRRPKELKISETRIKPSFERCFVARRSAKVVRALTFLTEQANINEKRRRILADIAQGAEHAWIRGNPKAGPPEKELFVRGARSRRKVRKWKLVPILAFSEDGGGAVKHTQDKLALARGAPKVPSTLFAFNRRYA